MLENRVRLVDIAEELGLSTATVSNVIHGKTKKISKETVKRVQELIEEKQYIPSMAGILLAQNASKIIGVVVNRHNKYENQVLEDPFISNSLQCLSEVIDGYDYFMMVKSTDSPKEIVRFASMWNMEGLVIIGFCEQDYDDLRSNMHIPFVVYDGFFKQINKYVNISVDNLNGGYLMGKYFMECGHSHILYLADNDTCMDHERFVGLRKAIKEAKNDAITLNSILIPITKKDRMLFYEQHLDTITKYTVVFAASDIYAIELMNYLSDKGIKVPDEISVAGFDGTPECNIVRPTLTTIRQDGAARAKIAIDMLRKQRERQEIQNKNIVIPVELVKGGSVRVLA